MRHALVVGLTSLSAALIYLRQIARLPHSVGGVALTLALAAPVAAFVARLPDSGDLIGPASRQASPDALNVVMVVIDTLRADHTQLAHYALETTQEDLIVLLRVRADPDKPELPSVAAQLPAATWPEREMHDLFGIEFTDHPGRRSPRDAPAAVAGPGVSRLPIGPARGPLEESAHHLARVSSVVSRYLLNIDAIKRLSGRIPLGQLPLPHPLGQPERSDLLSLDIESGLEAGCRRDQDCHRSILPGTHQRHVAAVVARRRVLLVGGVLLLVHHQ